MPTSTPVVSDQTSSSKCRRRSKIYGIRTFMDPGCPTDFYGSFRDNVRLFVRDCADVEDRTTTGMPTWCTLLVDEKSGVVVPFYTVEECVSNSAKPCCDYCRCSGWSHHLVSKRRYHFIIPADDEWDKPLKSNALNITTHLLHGLLHCNGFGHLLLVNGQEGGSKFISGCVFMDLWDRLCTSLRVREVSVEDVSKKYSIDLRLLFGMAYGTPWFARWDYRFRFGSFGITELSYNQAIENLSFLSLNSLLTELDANTTKLNHIITTYCKLYLLNTVRDLLRFLIDLNNQALLPHTPIILPQPPPPPKKLKKQKTEIRKCRNFASVAANLASRWPVRRLITVAQVVVNVLIDHSRKMTRQEVRDAARLTIGDTGLIDFVLKSMGNTVIDGYVVHRKTNPSNRVLEFSVSKHPNSSDSADENVAVEPSKDEDDDIVDAARQVKQDLQFVCECITMLRPQETQILLNAKHWVKTFALRDEADDLLRFQIQWMASAAEMEQMTRALPPTELVVLDTHASIEDLRAEAEKAMRDTYCLMEKFKITEMEGIYGEYWEAVMFAGVQSGATIWVKGELGSDNVSSSNELLKFEGGADTWSIGCGCGARDDDGERMVACDACDVWHHTRCIGIEDEEPVPQLFLCAKCGSSILAAAEEEERNHNFGIISKIPV